MPVRPPARTRGRRGCAAPRHRGRRTAL